MAEECRFRAGNARYSFVVVARRIPGKGIRRQLTALPRGQLKPKKGRRLPIAARVLNLEMFNALKAAHDANDGPLFYLLATRMLRRVEWKRAAARSDIANAVPADELSTMRATIIYVPRVGVE